MFKKGFWQFFEILDRFWLVKTQFMEISTQFLNLNLLSALKTIAFIQTVFPTQIKKVKQIRNRANNQVQQQYCVLKINLHFLLMLIIV